jgi:TnsA endonuclease N terminal
VEGLFIFMAYSGQYKPSNPRKYRGNPTRIIYRSMWERKFMVFCDHNENIIEWGSEEIIVPYLCPTDGKVHRYYPDFYIKVKSRNGSITKYIIEVKPKRQVLGPNDKPKRKTAAWKREVLTFIKNQAKWEAAKDFCEDRQMKFLILTEDHLGV